MINLFNFKKVFKTPKTKIPRRQITVKSTELLRNTSVILKEMLENSCPCHYPRFRELTTFLHDNYKAGPVFCADTNYIISCSTSEKLGYLTEVSRISDGALGDYDDIIYCCRKCSTTYREVTRQYSINFEFSYFIIENEKFGKDIGAKVSMPFPIFQGLFGFDDKDIIKCSENFNLANSTEFYNYLTEKA